MLASLIKILNFQAFYLFIHFQTKMQESKCCSLFLSDLANIFSRWKMANPGFLRPVWLYTRDPGGRRIPADRADCKCSSCTICPIAQQRPNLHFVLHTSHILAFQTYIYVCSTKVWLNSFLKMINLEYHQFFFHQQVKSVNLTCYICGTSDKFLPSRQQNCTADSKNIAEKTTFY